MKSYSIVVIGAGSAGLVVAIGCAKAGKKVLLIERGNWGGECTNSGCIPSKTLIGAAAKHQSGTEALSAVRRVVKSVRAHEEEGPLREKGVETLDARAFFVDPHTLQVEEESGESYCVRADRVVIAAGSSARIPELSGLEGTPFLTNETVFDLEEAPSSLIVLGGGPIGCELAQAFQRLGSEVRLVHRHKLLLGRESREAAEVLEGEFKKEGMQLYLGYEPESVQHDGENFALKLKGCDEVLSAEKLLVATGRESNVEGLELEKAGVKFSEKGIEVDAYARTNQKHIFAVGDCAGPPFFTHLAENRARAVLTTLLLYPFWKKRVDENQAMPRVTYTDPEVASIGLSESQAMEKYGNKRIAVYRVPMSEVDRAITQERTEGFIQIVTKHLSSQILGATIVAPRAGEMLCELSLAMHQKIPLRKLAGLIHPYPTYSLAVRKAADLWLTQTLLPIFKR